MTESPTSSFTGSVFIAASLDGFIATPDGDLAWLTGRAEAIGDTGYDDFIASVDAIAMGRNTYEKTLTFGGWPYEGLQAFVLSSTLDPASDPKVGVHPTVDDLIAGMNASGVRSVYVDGGMLIGAFLERGLISEFTLTTAPVILGSGIPLFHRLPHEIPLQLAELKDLGGGFTQAEYTVSDSRPVPAGRSA
ncbi:dihydrofolate reductase family protein [Lysobacter korlensis]|uniref:Dihydrofolate reductase family protein n=1 Tax=Lysobacter korlensis TaxID=553636 RepID=A0ABV6S088_9GAMM